MQHSGFEDNFKPVEFNSLVGKLSDTLDWDTMIMGLTGGTLEPHGGRNVWQSTGTLHLFNQRLGKDLSTKADLRDWEKQLDNTFELGARTLDIKKRKEIYNRYQQIVYDQDPVVYLFSGLRIIAIRDKFMNIKPTPLGGDLHNLEEIYVKK